METSSAHLKEESQNAEFVWSKTMIYTSPAFDATFLDAENKDCATLYHCSSFRVIETAGDAWNHTLTCSMDESKSMPSGLNITDEKRYIWVARHYGMSKFEYVGQLRVLGCATRKLSPLLYQVSRVVLFLA